jgi:DnaK suppressor protein
MIRTEAGVEADVRHLLVERRRTLLDELHERMRDVREQGAYVHRRSTLDDVSEDETDDLAFTVIQLKADILRRVDQAVRRVDEGTYGYCGECGDAIALPRLRAMPFASRCKDCEEARERPVPRQ